MFKLDFKIAENEKQINYRDEIISLGSCFSERIGQNLIENKFTSLNNPFGSLFSPYSIFKILDNDVDENDIIESQGVFYHWDASSEISSLDKKDLTHRVGSTLQSFQSSLRSCDWLIITLGTSYCYRYKKTKRTVANCHKIPQVEFEKFLLKPDEIVSQYHSVMNSIREANPELKVIITISPVRHIKDGLQGNNISKGILHQAVSNIIASDPLSSYFPAYEIMIDELRDYRFYERDMIHPNNQAIDYIWENFRKAFIDTPSNNFIDKWSKIKASMHHKPFHPESEKHQVFLKDLIVEIRNFEKDIDVTPELEELSKRIIKQ
ncbi:MAG: GSCFA domain-containing protein [Cyclobacteriaceae bacterium]